LGIDRKRLKPDLLARANQAAWGCHETRGRNWWVDTFATVAKLAVLTILRAAAQLLEAISTNTFKSFAAILVFRALRSQNALATDTEFPCPAAIVVQEAFGAWNTHVSATTLFRITIIV
jgi:hypothetical protein